MKVFLRFLKPYWKLFVLSLVVVVFDVAGALMIPTITAEMINLGVGGGEIGEILEKGAVMFAVAFAAGTGALIGSWLCAHLAAELGRDIRNAVYEKSLAFSASDFEQFGTGSMITRTLSDTNIIQQAFTASVQMILPVPVMVVMGIVFAFRINRDMGVMLLGVMLLVIFVAGVIVRKASLIFEKLQQFLDRMNVVLRENITGVRVIRAFNKEGHEKGRMKKTFEDYAQAAISANRLFAALDSWAILAINTCITAIFWLGGGRVAAGEMRIGDITALIEYAVLTLYYIIMAQMILMLLPRAMICLRRIGEVLDYVPEITDGKPGKENRGTGKENRRREDLIRFEKVSFCFGDADEDTLHGLDFVCKKGETTAVIGGTGSGKTTIARLILRYHDVTEGQVLFGNRDVREMSQRELRERISYVPQKAWLFSGTIRDNLKYGKETAGEGEMSRALRIAQADFVHHLPKGLDAPVAQGGTNFSGGQKQRLSIARALVKQADLYVFDDSFSALDFKTDAALRKALAEELQDAAILIIAQRISTVVHAHQILVLDDGRIVGKGTHEYLLEHCPVYRDIAVSQMKGGEKDGRKTGAF